MRNSAVQIAIFLASGEIEGCELEEMTTDGVLVRGERKQLLSAIRSICSLQCFVDGDALAPPYSVEVGRVDGCALAHLQI